MKSSENVRKTLKTESSLSSSLVPLLVSDILGNELPYAVITHQSRTRQLQGRKTGHRVLQSDAPLSVQNYPTILGDGC